MNQPPTPLFSNCCANRTYCANRTWAASDLRQHLDLEGQLPGSLLRIHEGHLQIFSSLNYEF